MSSPKRCILSTGNIMIAGPEVIRRPRAGKSNTELVNGLRENIKASMTPPIPCSPTRNSASNPSPSSNGAPATLPLHEWTSTDPSTNVLYVPALEDSPLTDSREEYDITVKLFHLASTPPPARPDYTKEALALVCQQLGVQRLDLVITSFPDVSFDADDDLKLASNESEVEEWLSTYRTLESLYDAGTISGLGICEFGTARLDQLLPRTRIKPIVDQINVRDCCVVPEPLILYAKEKGIELLTHNDCTNILPADTLNALVNGELKLFENCEQLAPQWVVKYTAVTRSRGVVENKGYMTMAEIH